MIDEIVCAGRTAVVTGAASGIGLAAVRRFAAAGMNVCLADRYEEALADALGGVCALPGVEPDRVLTVATDVADIAHVQVLHDAAYRRFGEVALLMNNAAVGDQGGPWSDAAAWRRVLDINLWGVLHGLQGMRWADDMIKGRPALSRWHPDFKDEFESFMEAS